MEDSLIVERPWNLDNDTASTKVGGAPLQKLPDLPVGQGLQPLESEAPTDSSTLMQNIMDTAYKGAVKKNPTNFDSKFQDSSLSDRYQGKSVQYGDYKLDPKALDARYSKTQSYAEQSFNSLKVGLANGGSMFAIGFVGIPSLLSNIKNGLQGKAAEASDLENSIYDWSREVADNNTNFQNEQDLKTDVWSTIKNVLLPSAISGSSGGYGKIFENVMYGVGAGAAIAAQEAAVSFLLPGVGNSVVLGTSVAKLLNNVGNIAKYSKLVNRIVETSGAIGEVSAALNTSNKIKNAARWAWGSSIGAHGEAAFEGIEGRHAMEQQLTEKFKREKGYNPTGDDLKGINELAKQAGSVRYWTNVGLLMGTNSFQLKRLFTNIDLAREGVETLAKQGLKVGVNETGEVVAKKSFELTSDWFNRGFQKKWIKPVVEPIAGKLSTDSAKEAFSEGFEEFTQGWIDKSVNNFYTWRMDHRGQPALDQAMKSAGEGFAESWNTEGLSAFLSGAIAGVGQQAMITPFTLKQKLDTNKAQKTELDETLKKYTNDFKASDFFEASHANEFVASANINSVRGDVVGRAETLNALGLADTIAEDALDRNDKKTYKDMETLSFFNMAKPYVERGHAGILKDQMAFAINNMETDGALQELTGNPNITKEQAITEFNEKVDKVNTSFSKIQNAFKNPYNAHGDEIEQGRYAMFQNYYLPELAYLDHRVGNLLERSQKIQDTLGPDYDDLKYFADESTLDSGRKYIEQQLDQIKGSEAYLKELGTADSQIGEVFQREQYVAKLYQESLEKLDALQSDPTQENMDDFSNTYYNAFTSRRGMYKSGFIDKNARMQSVQDVARIRDDLQSVQDMLSKYLKPSGEELFRESWSAANRKEQRKRLLFLQSSKFKDLMPELLEANPELTPEEVEEVVSKSSSVDDAKAAVDALAEERKKELARVADIENKVRDLFIAKSRGDEVEDYLASNPVKKQDETRYIGLATTYLAVQDNSDVASKKASVMVKFMHKAFALGGFEEDATLIHDFNQHVFDNLSLEDKIKYTKANIEMLENLRDIEGVDPAYKNVQNNALKNATRRLKIYEQSLPNTKQAFSKTVGNYVISKKSGDKGFQLSKGGTHLGEFPSEQLAEKEIEKLENAEAKKTEVRQDLVANLPNKFNNGYFNPQWYDKNGNKIGVKNNNVKEKADLFNRIANNKTEAQVNDMIRQNSVSDVYTMDGRPGTTQIFGPKGVNKNNLPYEPVLHSAVADTIVISYLDGENKIALNSYKHPKTGLAFADRSILEKLVSKDVVDFVAGLTYYQFLQKSVSDPSAFNSLVANKMIGFKGDPQQQLDMIEGMQRTWDAMSVATTEELRTNFSFERLFQGQDYDNQVTMDITSLPYEFAQVSQEPGGAKVNQRVFFYIKDNFINTEVKGEDIKFIGLPDNFHDDAREMAVKSITSRHRGLSLTPEESLQIKDKLQKDISLIKATDRTSVIMSIVGKGLDSSEIKQGLDKFKELAIEVITNRANINLRDKGQLIYGGYFMLVTDSSGSPSYHKLVYKNIETADFYAQYKQSGFTNLAIIAHDDTLKIDYEVDSKRFKIEDKTDDSYTYVTYTISSEEAVKGMHTAIINGLGHKDKTWYRKTDEGTTEIKKMYPVDTIVTSLIEKSRYAPTSQEEILNYKQVTGINPEQYLTKKLEVKVINPMDRVGFTGIPQVVMPQNKTIVTNTTPSVVTPSETSDKSLTQDIADSLGIVLPDFISTDEIDTFVDRIEGGKPKEQIARVLVLAIAEHASVTDGPFYLNSEGLNLKMTNNFAKETNDDVTNSKITAAVRTSKAKLNLFTDRKPYAGNKPTGQEIEDRVQALLKNCIK